MAEKKVTRVDNGTTENQKIENAPKTVEKADPKTAKSKRIIAWILWVLAFGCEVMAFLIFAGKVDLRFCPQMAQLIGFLVIDFILVVIGAQFWKKANRLDPVSDSKKFRFWLHNNMGVIVCCFAFLPFLIYVLFIDKKADPKLKKAASIAAAVALLIGAGLSYDWNPVSQEGLEKAQETLNGVDVYWTQFGSVYHTDINCQHLNRSAEAFVGDVATAIYNGKTRLCKTCAKNSGIETDDNGAVVSAAAAVVESLPESDQLTESGAEPAAETELEAAA